MASAASRRGPTRVLARQRRAASSQTASITRFRPATIRAGRYVAPRSPHQLKTRSPSHRTMATLTTRVHSSQTAWLAAASAQGSSSTAHQANSSQVSAPVWYVWPSNASRAPSRMPASASRRRGWRHARRRRSAGAIRPRRRPARRRPTGPGRRRIAGPCSCPANWPRPSNGRAAQQQNAQPEGASRQELTPSVQFGSRLPFSTDLHVENLRSYYPRY